MVYIKHFPLSGNPHSEPAARAALAAHRQGKFKQMHKVLLDNQEAHSVKELLVYAHQIGLDMAKFQADFKDPELVALVQKNKQEGIEAGVEGTPAVYMDGQEFTDPLGFPFLKDWIDEYLAVNR